MKKILVVIISLVMVMSMISCEKDDTAIGMNLGTLNLKGDVASVKMEMVSTFSGEPVSLFLFDMGFIFSGNREIFFNDDGMVDYYLDYDKDNSVRQEKYFFYDNNNMVEREQVNFYAFGNLDGELITKRESKNNEVLIENDTIQGELYVVNDGVEEKVGYVKYELDENNRTVKLIQYATGMPKEVYNTIEYNEDGLITGMTYFDGEIILSESTIEYDVKNNMKTLEVSNSDEVITYTFEYEFDDENNWTEQRVIHGEEHKYTVTRVISYQ